MSKILSFLYTIATVLIIVGALFILQGEVYGMPLLVLGLTLNIVYRTLNLDVKKLRTFQWLEMLRFGGLLFMGVACLSFVLELEQRFNLLILSIVLDLLLNMKEISFKRKA